MTTSANIHRAFVTNWNATRLDDEHKQYWPTADRTRYPALHDTQASPQQPFPYTVFEFSPGVTISRTSGGGGQEVHEYKAFPLELRVYAKNVSGSNPRSAKQLANELATMIMARFGGHPTAAPTLMELEHGQHVLTEHVSDDSMREGDDEWHWLINYIVRAEIPVMT